ncbi:RNA polymerase sigma factor [Nannocystis pusilla]|uniref:RNA polymerase sigma factor n=1 Tax=Nannocystis pusilla TaxID=889268 RepID=UPI003BF31BB7
METPTPEASGSAATPHEAAADSEHPLVVLFAAWMAGSQQAGRAMLQSTAEPSGVWGRRDHLGKGKNPRLEPTSPLTARLAVVVRWFMTPREKPIDLDEGLGRFDGTTQLGMEHPLIRGDVRRLHVLQRELQRKCLTVTLGNLAAGPRAAFVLRWILGLSDDQIAEVFGTVEAVKTNGGRALRDLRDSLTPICEHIDPGNGCRCRNRLAGAVERGFVTWPDRDDLDGDRPLLGQAHQDVESLYPKLPPPP